MFLRPWLDPSSRLPGFLRPAGSGEIALSYVFCQFVWLLTPNCCFVEHLYRHSVWNSGLKVKYLSSGVQWLGKTWKCRSLARLFQPETASDRNGGGWTRGATGPQPRSIVRRQKISFASIADLDKLYLDEQSLAMSFIELWQVCVCC